MQSFSSALLLACLHGGLQLQLASARRLSSRPGQSLSESASSAHTQRQIRKESWKYEGEEEPVQKCVYAEDLVLQCPEAGKRVGIVAAFWNRRKRTGCRGEDRDFKAGLHCNPNATEKVIEICQGQQGGSCTVPQGFTGCEENPFTFMRVRWHCLSATGDVATATTTTEPAEEEVEEDMALEEAGRESPEGLAQKPKRVDERDADVKKWKETPDRRLAVSSLRKEHCNGLEVGSWPKLGETGCELGVKTGGLGSSPHFDDDPVCACHFFTPRGAKTDCGKIFPKPDSAYKTKGGKGGSIAIFGKEGCDCHPSPEQKGWTICDLAVREV